jgi:hypothetical protein
MSAKSSRLNKKYSKKKYTEINYIDVCKFVREYKMIQPMSSSNHFSKCESYFNGRLQVGLYPTSIELLNRFQLLVNDFPSDKNSTSTTLWTQKTKKDKIEQVYKVLDIGTLLDIKFTLDLTREYMKIQRVHTS